jgi:6-phosphogluconolactonase (cycloisomerase 2 family)
VIAPNGGYGFGPRHLDFHPTKPWLYVCDERTNRLYMFACPDDHVGAAPSYTRNTLAEPDNVRPRQLGGPIHVHPNGRFVYVVNRADQNVDNVFLGGENNIAVFAIDPDSGAPTLIQHAPTQSFHVRTFALDPSGRLLVTASIMPLSVSEENRVRHVPAALSVFRVGEDGLLSFVGRYDVETEAAQRHYWAGIVGLT